MYQIKFFSPCKLHPTSIFTRGMIHITTKHQPFSTIPKPSSSSSSHHINSKLLDKIKELPRIHSIALTAHWNKVLTNINYSDIDHASNVLAKELISNNIHTKKTSIGCFNSCPLTFVVALLATWKIGKVFVPLSVSHTINELSYFIQDSNTGIVLCNQQTDLTADQWPAVGASTVITVEPILKKALTQTARDDATNAAVNGTLETIRLPGSNDALILYTSGTTGQPKGVVHTHDSIEHIIRSLVESWAYSKNDKILHFLPLYHMHGLMNKLLCILWSGGSVEFLESAKAKDIWHRLAEEGRNLSSIAKTVNLFMAVPTVYAKMLEYSKTMDAKEKEAGIQAMKSMRLMVCGSAALPDPVMDNWYALTGQRLLERYGMTELGMALSNPLEGERRKGFVGFPLPYVNVRLVDDHGQVITTPNTPGELQVTGKTVFKRYLNKPEATRDTFDGNWFKTGDISEVSVDGYYKILGRNSTDIIKSAGYKISALEIERELLSHPKVLEVAVIGKKHDELGELIAAIIVLRDEIEDGNIQREMDQHLSDKLAKYKTPRKYYLVDSLPRNHLGKVNKKTILKDLNLE